MKKILASLLIGIFSLCFSQNNWIYYNRVNNETWGYFSIWRVDENGENETFILEQGHLLDISDDGEYILLSQSGNLALLNAESGILDGLGIQAQSFSAYVNEIKIGESYTKKSYISASPIKYLT